MAALDLHCGVDPGMCVWDVMDSFDSEMQQWEEQLQDVQRKIEELYKVVEARRGANERSPNSNTHLDITLLSVDNATACPDRGEKVNDVPVHHSTFKYPSNYTNDTCTYPVNYHNGFLGPETYTVNGGQDVTLDILDEYLGLDTDLRRSQQKPCGAPNMSSKGNQSDYTYKNGSNQWPITSRNGCVSPGKFEELQNRKNKSSVLDEPRVRHVSWKDPVSSPEKSVNKPPIKQRDGPHVPVRPAHFSDSPMQQDRKCPLVDRKCGSPSVLRKFGAMLQENEGKTLIEDGNMTKLVPNLGPNLVPKSPRLGGSRASKHVPVQKCLKDSEVPLTLQNGEHRGTNVGIKTSHWAPTVQGVDSLLQSDSKMVERNLGNYSTSQYQVKCNDAGLMNANQRNTATPYQVSLESSPNTSRRSFSRPARPANQRPPSRWASHGPTGKITTPVGPRARSLSPVCKTKQRFNNFSLYTETVIM